MLFEETHRAKSRFGMSQMHEAKILFVIEVLLPFFDEGCACFMQEKRIDAGVRYVRFGKVGNGIFTIKKFAYAETDKFLTTKCSCLRSNTLHNAWDSLLNSITLSLMILFNFHFCSRRRIRSRISANE